MDDLDQANDLAVKITESAIENRVTYDECGGTPDCVTCGDEISLQRRKAMPSAKTCVSCQSASER